MQAQGRDRLLLLQSSARQDIPASIPRVRNPGAQNLSQSCCRDSWAVPGQVLGIKEELQLEYSIFLLEYEYFPLGMLSLSPKLKSGNRLSRGMGQFHHLWVGSWPEGSTSTPRSPQQQFPLPVPRATKPLATHTLNTRAMT